MRKEMSSEDVANAQFELMMLIKEHPNFKKIASEICKEYPRLSTWPGFPPYCIGADFDPSEAGEDICGYCHRIAELAETFKLPTKTGERYKWSLQAVHDFVSSKRYVGITWVETPRAHLVLPLEVKERYVVVSLRLCPDTTRADVNEVLKLEWDKIIIPALKQLSKSRPRRPRPRPSSELEKHVRWLYMHVIEQETSHEISQKEYNTLETVTHAINRLSKELQIPTRRGRPKKGGTLDT